MLNRYRLLDISKVQGVLLVGFVVILYSTLGGIKSVTFTDMIQFFTFGTIILLVSYYLFYNLSMDVELIISTIKNSPDFNFNNIFDSSNVKSWTYLFLFFLLFNTCFLIFLFFKEYQ